MTVVEELAKLLDRRRDSERDLTPRRVVGRNPDGTLNVESQDGECVERWTGNERVDQITLLPDRSAFADRGATAVASSSSGLGLIWLESQEPEVLRAGATQIVRITGRGFSSSLELTYLKADLSDHPQVSVGDLTVIDSETLEVEVTVADGSAPIEKAPIRYGVGGTRTLVRPRFYGITPAVLYRAVERVDATHLKVGTYSDGLDFVEILHNVTVPQGVLGDNFEVTTINGLITVITGDGDLPDGSIAFFARAQPGAGSPTHDGGPWYLYTLDIDSGTLRSATIPLKDGYDDMEVVRGLDFYQGKLRFLVWYSGDGDVGVGDDDVIDVYAADTLLEEVEIVQTVGFGNLGYNPLCWGRVGNTAQVLRWDNTNLRGIDSINLTSSGFELGPGRLFPAGALTHVNAIGVHSDGARTFFVVLEDVFPRWYLALVSVGISGDATLEAWPSKWLRYLEWDLGGAIAPFVSFSHRASTGSGLYLSHVRGTSGPAVAMLRTDSDVFDTSEPAPTEAVEVTASMAPHFLFPI